MPTRVIGMLQAPSLRGSEKNVGWLKPRRIYLGYLVLTRWDAHDGAAIVIGIGHSLSLGVS